MDWVLTVTESGKLQEHSAIGYSTTSTSSQTYASRHLLLGILWNCEKVLTIGFFGAAPTAFLGGNGWVVVEVAKEAAVAATDSLHHQQRSGLYAWVQLNSSSRRERSVRGVPLAQPERAQNRI